MMSAGISRGRAGCAVIALVALLGACASGIATEDGWAVEEYQYGDYRFELRKRKDGDDILTLYRLAIPLLTVVETEVRLEHDPAARPIGMALGSDVTGDGEPNAVVRTGAGGGFNGLIVLEIGERFRELARIDSMASGIVLRDLDGQPGREIMVRDEPISSWATNIRRTRAPFVVFAYDGEAYRVAEDLMRRPPLDEDEWITGLGAVRVAAEASAAGEARPPSILWRTVIDLIYGGNITQAWAFLDAAWQPAWRRGQEASREALLCEVQGSRYWAQIAALNGLDSDAPDACRRWGPARDWTHAQYRIGDYVLALEKQKIGDDQLVVYRAGEIVYFLADHRIHLESFPGAELRGSRSDADITGDGRPNALLTTWSGGAHCCFELIILELGERFCEVARIDGQDSEFSVEDLDGRPGLEIVFGDSQFVIWKAPASKYPMPLVILAYDGETYRMSEKLMRRPPLGEDDWAARIQAVHEDDRDYLSDLEPPPPTLWRVMLDLIYSGNMAQARPFLDAAWRPDWPRDGETFYGVFLCRLQGSSHWPALARLNGLASPRLMPEDCDDEGSENG